MSDLQIWIALGIIGVVVIGLLAFLCIMDCSSGQSRIPGRNTPGGGDPTP
jgi:hypothetical protein